MLIWKDIGFKKCESGLDCQRVSDLANGYAGRIGQLPSSGDSYDASSMASSLIRAYERFFEETKIVLRWDDVPREKKRLDHEQFMRAMFLGYKKPFGSSVEHIDEEVDHFSGRTSEKDKRMSFYHSVECVVSFSENSGFSREEASVFLEKLLNGKVLYDPLYVREMLNHPERLGLDAESKNPEELAWTISENHERSVSYDEGKIPEIANEEAIAEKFFAQRKGEGAFPNKFVVHSVDSQAPEKSWRTYEQFAAYISGKLGSVATFGLVPGGVLGGINPTELYGTLDRADLVIMNWYPQYQGGVVIPLDALVQEGFGCKFTGSMSVMIDGERGRGRDVITSPNEEMVLPYLHPSEFVVVVPVELQGATADTITSLHHRLVRPPEEIGRSLERCIGYDPNLWKNFHYFNEWLQTTPEGNAHLEERIGRPVSDLKNSDQIEANIREGRFTQRT